MRIEVKTVEDQITQAMRQNFSKTASLLIRRMDFKTLAATLGNIELSNRNIDPSNKNILKLAVKHLTLDQKLYFLNEGSSTYGMDVMFTPIMQDPQIQEEIKRTFNPTWSHRTKIYSMLISSYHRYYPSFSRPDLILNPIFIQALALHLTIYYNIYSRAEAPTTIWESFSDPITTFCCLVKACFIDLYIESHSGKTSYDPYYYLALHKEFHYRGMVNLRLEAKTLFPEAFLKIDEDVVNLLRGSIVKDDFWLYGIALQNLVAIGATKEAAGYTTPIYLDPKYCSRYDNTTTTIFGEDFSDYFPNVLIPTLEAYQKIPEDHPVKLLINNWFNHEVTPSQLAYAKKLSEDLKSSDRQPLFDNYNLNRLIQQIVDNLIIQQEMEYGPINKVSKKVGETITSLYPQQVKFSESLSQLIGFFAEGDKSTTKDEKKEEDPKPLAIKQTVDKEDAPKQDGVLIEMDEKSKTDVKEQKEDKEENVMNQTIIENEIIAPPNYTEVATQFILEDIKKYLDDTKGFFSSMFNSTSRQILQPIANIIPTLAKNIRNSGTNSEPRYYALQVCLALLIDPQAQKNPAIVNLINIFYQKLVGKELAPIMKMDSKADKELQAALRHDVIDNIKMILTKRNLSCEDLSIIKVVNDLEVSLNKKPADEKATSESQLTLT